MGSPTSPSPLTPQFECPQNSEESAGLGKGSGGVGAKIVSLNHRALAVNQDAAQGNELTTNPSHLAAVRYDV